MSERRVRLLLAIFLLASVLLAYWRVLDAQFTNYDDPDYVTENPVVRRGLTADGLRWAWSGPHAANYHPLTWISHMLDASLFGSDPRGHHLTSLALHAANTLLLFFLLARITAATMRSALVALLFGVHPLHVESVAWIAERKDVLSTLFWLLTLWAYVGYVRSERGRFAPVVILLALGLCAKPMLVTVPATLLLLDFWPLARFDERSADARRTVSRLVREKLPLLPLVLASGFVTYFAQHRAGAFDAIPFLQRLANAVVSYVVYLRKTLWPSDLAVLYPHPRGSLPAWQVLLALGFLLAVTAWVVRTRRSRPYLLFGWLWYLVTLTPVIGIVQVGQQARADRYTYVPLVGIFVAMSWGLADLGRARAARWLARLARPGTQRGEETVAAIVGALASLALILATSVQVAYWHDSVTLFERARADVGDHPTVLVDLGSAYHARGDAARAAELFRKALQIDPRRVSAHSNLATVLVEGGHLAEAEEHYRTALTLDPDDPGTHNKLGLALVGMGRTDEAIEQYERALALDPSLDSAHNNLAIALAAGGQTDAAIQHYEEAIRIDPSNAKARNNLGLALARTGRADEAIRQLTAAIRADPESGAAHSNLAGVLYETGAYAEAWEHVHLARAHGQEPPAGLVSRLAERMPDPAAQR